MFAGATVKLEPISLDAVEINGATRMGRTVVKLVAFYSDGRRASLELPPQEIEEPEEVAMTPTQQKIMDALRLSPKPLTRKAIANEMGRESTGGKFAQYVADLVSRKIAHEYDSELTDDPAKFGKA